MIFEDVTIILPGEINGLNRIFRRLQVSFSLNNVSLNLKGVLWIYH
jgi:hypothetical protein